MTYQMVTHHRALRVAFQTMDYGQRRGQATKRCALTLLTRDGAIGRAWLPAVGSYGQSLTTNWAGERVSPYLPGLAALSSRTPE